MRGIRSAIVFLAFCLLLGCMSLPAAAQEIPQIQSGETVTFSTTKGNHIVYYSFTPQASGTYVLYDLSDCAFQVWVTAHSCNPADAGFDYAVLAKGMNQVVFQAEAGVTYWLKLDCAWISGGELSNSFKLAASSVPTGIDIGYASLNSNFVGAEGSLYLQYHPMGAASQIIWTTSDSEVVMVDGDDNGCRFRLTGGGNATITATSAEGHRATYHVTAQDIMDMTAGDSLTVSMFSNGSYVSDEKFIRFTPAENGTYALSVSYDHSVDTWHGVEMSMGSGTGYVRGDEVLRFDAEAGKTYIINVELWGMYSQKMDYTFSLQSCVSPDEIRLTSPATAGYIGSSIYFEVDWRPTNSLREKVTWSVSDANVAQVGDSDDGTALLRLLSAGTVTLTATTESGLTASVDVTVCQHPGTIVLKPGTNPSLHMLRNDCFDCTFTPEITGYYRIAADNQALKIVIDGPVVVRDGEKLYYLEAGTTYSGGIDNLTESVVQSVITVSLVEVPVPTAISITKLPNQTEFLPGILESIWVYDLLEGMEMTVTWSDGQITVWSFDTDGTAYEGYEVRWQLRNDGANRKELVMRLGDATASCLLTIKNLNVVSMELVDAAGIKIVENSCGYYDDYAKSWIYSDYLLGMYSVKITFDDGSSVTAIPDQTVYGKRLICQMDQYDRPWVKGGENFVTYTYGNLSIQVPVEIIDSPVRRIQFITKPKTVFAIGDRRFFVSYGDGTYYFSPDSLKPYLEGLSFRIYYNDDTSKVVAWEDVEWRKISGVSYPFVDGYPLGLMGELMMSFDPISTPCTSQGLVEYMGASLSYTIELVEPAEVTPETGDAGLVMPVTVALVFLLTMATVVIAKKKLM